MTGTPEFEKKRLLDVERIMNLGGTRRDMLKMAAAAGLIPVLTAEQVSARAAAAAQEATPVVGGTFVTLGHQSIDTLSPEEAGATVIWVALSQLFDPLYIVNEQYELEPILAESYEPSADGLTYTFKLRTGVTFTNGDEFTSADVKYTYDWIMDPANGSLRSGNFELVDSVEAPDPTTVVVTLKEADVTFMVNVAPTFIYPSAYHAEVGEEAFSAKPIGTGAFYLADPADYVPAQRVSLTANENYFKGRPNFDTFQLDVVPESAGRRTALESGSADNSIWDVSAEDKQALRDTGKFKIYDLLQNATNHFVVNHAHPFLGDVNVRKALLMATDREAILEEVYPGGAVATSHLSPNVTKFYNPNVTTYAYDPDAAAALLDEAGWVVGGDGIREKDGTKAQFTLTMITGDTQRRPIAEINQALWSEIGVEFEIVEGEGVVDGMIAGELDAALFNWVYGGGSGEPDCRDTLTTNGANNFGHWSNAEMDELLALGITQLNDEDRIATYNRTQEIVAEEVPFLFFVNPPSVSFWANTIGGLPETVVSSDNMYQKIYLYWKNPAE
jgi:peptide/nickel transport system substrate-binding protein